jgi:hypothetical protein
MNLFEVVVADVVFQGSVRGAGALFKAAANRAPPADADTFKGGLV